MKNELKNVTDDESMHLLFKQSVKKFIDFSGLCFAKGKSTYLVIETKKPEPRDRRYTMTVMSVYKSDNFYLPGELKVIEPPEKGVNYYEPVPGTVWVYPDLMIENTSYKFIGTL